VFTGVDDAELSRRFEKFGGIPRYVLEEATLGSEWELQRQLGVVSIESLKDIFHSTSYVHLPLQRETSMLVHVIPHPEDEGGYLSVFATPYVRKLLAEKFVFNSAFNAAAFQQAVSDTPEFASWRGYMLEALTQIFSRRGQV
jgi:hypothetical protein